MSTDGNPWTNANWTPDTPAFPPDTRLLAAHIEQLRKEVERLKAIVEAGDRREVLYKDHRGVCVGYGTAHIGNIEHGPFVVGPHQHPVSAFYSRPPGFTPDLDAEPAIGKLGE